MKERPIRAIDSRHLRYRLVIEGRLVDLWAGWFGCEHFHCEGDQTVFDVEVVDQAQLHGVLRRVHDLHLRLVSVARVAESETIPLEGGVP